MFTIYSKGESCPYCVKAEQMLTEKKIPHKIVMIPSEMSRDDLLAMVSSVNKKVTTKNLTVPQIFREGEIGSRVYIGGYEDLARHLMRNKHLL
jgi:glutaredoxin